MYFSDWVLALVAVAHLSVGVCPACQQVPRFPAADPFQLTSGEMADLDGSDASPPESQGEFLATVKFTLTNFLHEGTIIEAFIRRHYGVFV